MRLVVQTYLQRWSEKRECVMDSLMRVSWALIERFLRLDKERKRWSRLTRVISGTASLSLGNLQGHVYFFEGEKKKKRKKKLQ